MKFLNLRLSLLAFGTVAALVSTSAHAVWVFDTSGNVTASNTAGVNTGEFRYSGSSASDPKVSLSGFAATNDASGIVSGAWLPVSLTSFGTSGVGMTSTGESSQPNHALDNSAKTEAVLLSFDSSIILSSIGFGWTASGYCRKSGYDNTALSADGTCATGYTKVTKQTDGTSLVDISLFRWTGATSSSGTWELVGNYGDIAADKVADPGYSTVNQSGKSSSWWLVSAYNSGFGTTANDRGGLTNGDDYFKLYAVAGTATSPSTGKLPEPASLALTGVALLGVAGLRRRSKANLAA